MISLSYNVTDFHPTTCSCSKYSGSQGKSSPQNTKTIPSDHPRTKPILVQSSTGPNPISVNITESPTFTYHLHVTPPYTCHTVMGPQARDPILFGSCCCSGDFYIENDPGGSVSSSHQVTDFHHQTFAFHKASIQVYMMLTERNMEDTSSLLFLQTASQTSRRYHF
jgi:hypothetical protein